MAAAAPNIDPEPPSINNEAAKLLPDPCGLFPRVTPTHALLNTEIYPPSAAPMAGAATPTVAAAASEFNPRQPSVTNETTKSPTDSFGLFPHVTPMTTSLNLICPPPPASVAGAAFAQLDLPLPHICPVASDLSEKLSSVPIAATMNPTGGSVTVATNGSVQPAATLTTATLTASDMSPGCWSAEPGGSSSAVDMGTGCSPPSPDAFVTYHADFGNLMDGIVPQLSRVPAVCQRNAPVASASASTSPPMEAHPDLAFNLPPDLSKQSSSFAVLKKGVEKYAERTGFLVTNRTKETVEEATFRVLYPQEEFAKILYRGYFYCSPLSANRTRERVSLETELCSQKG